MSDSSHELTVVIRGVGERTEKICQALLAEQVPASNIFVTHVSPFSAALKKSYELGIAAGRPWTMVIDADVLVREDIVKNLLALANKQPKSVFAVQSEMIDKFFGGQRVGGIKLYRTNLLPMAVQLVPAVNVRPETFVIKSMHKSDYYVKISDLVCGLHDFEQYYSDIFRKGFAHGIKHANLTDLLLPYWQRMASQDPDFAILLAGFKLGKAHAGDLKLAKNEVAKECAAFFRKSKIKEKTKLKLDSYSCRDIDSLITNFQPPPEYTAVKQAIDAMGRPSVPRQWFGLQRLFKSPK